MFYKTLSPGNIGFAKTFMESAKPTARAGFEGYAFSANDFRAEPAEIVETL